MMFWYQIYTSFIYTRPEIGPVAQPAIQALHTTSGYGGLLPTPDPTSENEMISPVSLVSALGPWVMPVELHHLFIALVQSL